MKFVVATGLLLASVLTAQAQSQNNVSKRALAQAQITAATNANYAQVQSRPLRAYNYDLNNPWDGPRTCY